MLELLIVRHGETAWNAKKRIMGRLPVPLNSRGRGQAGDLARYLSGVKIHEVYSSPALRAVQTAEFLARPNKVKVNLEDSLVEIDYGEWVGKTFDEVIKEKAFKLYHTNPKGMRVPGGETLGEAQDRVVRFIEKIRLKHSRSSGVRRVSIVTHADVVKLVVAHYMGMGINHFQKFRVDNCTLTVLWFCGERARLVALNSPPLGKVLFKTTVPKYLMNLRAER